MKADEIKETLEYKIDFLTKSLNIGIPTKNRRYFNDIKDYITNLQQEKYELERDNKHLNGLLDTALNEQDRLQNENERLEQKLRDSIKFSECRTKDWLDYKSRCEKAIEYIGKQKKKMYKSRNKIAMFILMKLENILQNERNKR